MLLPALQQARERGRTAHCLANMKQLGQAWKMYQGDYNDWCPGGFYKYFYASDTNALNISLSAVMPLGIKHSR